MRLAAVTGATGFLGRHLVHALQAEGWRVRALARRTPGPWIGDAPDVTRGDLEDGATLRRLCRGADAVIHAAGLVSARRDPDFARINTAGAREAALAAREAAPGADFLLVSSLAAREPALSPYAASKRAGEDAVQAVCEGRAQVARPSAVYGPGDRASAPLFRAVGASPLLLRPSDGAAPARARITLVHVADAARDLAAMLARPEAGRTAAVSDDRIDGYAWREIADALEAAAGAPRRFLPVAPALLRLAGAGGDLLRALGVDTLASTGKMREILHGDWSITAPDRFVGAPHRSLAQGFRETLGALMVTA